MKTITQMQNDMISKASFVGGYPRIVMMGLSIIASAKNEDEFLKFQKQSKVANVIFGTGLFAVIVSMLICFILV